MKVQRLFVASLLIVHTAVAADFPGLPTEEAALLNAIIAHPEEDTPRLVYADWLDEHDDPLRAEFIRLQVKLYRMDPNDGAFASLKEREKALLAMPKATRVPREYVERRKALLQELLPEQVHDKDELGFIRAIQQNPLDDEYWRAYSDWLDERHTDSHWSRALRIQNALGGNYFNLQYSRGFPEGIQCGRGAIDHSGAVLNALPFLRSLTITAHIRNPHPQETARVLSALKIAADVQELQLNFPVVAADINRIGPAFKRLKHLSLEDPTLSGLQAVLAGALGTQLETLDVKLGDMEHWGSEETLQAVRLAFTNWASRNPPLKEISRDLHAFLPPNLQKTVKVIDHQSECNHFLASFAHFD